LESLVLRKENEAQPPPIPSFFARIHLVLTELARGLGQERFARGG
jgi:hypothetical protein